MKKVLYLLVFVVLFLTGCATSVDVHYLQPSEIDMGQARNIAIASTIPYKGRTGGRDYIRFSNFVDYNWFFRSSYSDMRLKDRVAEYATRELEDTLEDTGYFNILDRRTTDTILSAGKSGFDTNSMFIEKGVEAVIIPRISGMDIDEFIYRTETIKKVYDPSTEKEVEVKEYKYFLSQIVSLDFEYSIISTKTEQIVATKRFSKTIYNEDVPVKYLSRYNSEFDLYNMFRRCIDSFQGSIVKQLVPLGRSTSISLMENKPKDKSIEVAYNLVKEGNIIGAKELFLEHYNATGFIPSGYNSALLSASIGDFNTAISELKVVLKNSSNSEVYNLLSKLQEFRKKTEKAEDQIKGESGGFILDGRVDVYNQVMGD